MNNPDEVIMTFAEFLSGAQTTDLFEQVAEEIAKEQNKTIVIDSRARRDEEWSLLANQIVGGEVSVLPSHKAVPQAAEHDSQPRTAGQTGTPSLHVKS
jgi:hypothetical protein